LASCEVYRERFVVGDPAIPDTLILYGMADGSSYNSIVVVDQPYTEVSISVWSGELFVR